MSLLHPHRGPDAQKVHWASSARITGVQRQENEVMLGPSMRRMEVLRSVRVNGSLTVLSGAPGTFSSSQRPVHPSSRARRGRSRGSGGSSTMGKRTEVRRQGSFLDYSFVPPALPSPSRSISIILKPPPLPDSPEVERGAVR